MCTGSASMMRLRGFLLLTTLLVVPAPALAAGTVQLIAQNYADSPNGLSISRDSIIAVPYRATPDNYDLFVYGTNIGIIDPGLPPIRRVFSAEISKWGLAVLTDRNGFIPNDIYAAPLGQQLQLIQDGSGYASLHNLALNDAGVVSFNGRFTTSHGPNIAFRWRPNENVQQPPLNETDGYFTSNLDATGRLYILASEESTQPFTYRVQSYSDSEGWRNRTAAISSVSAPAIGNIVNVNPSGQFTFPATYNNGTKHGIYLATGSEFKLLFDRTSVNQTLTPIRADVTLSDLGDVLAIIGIDDAPLNKRSLLYTHDGRTLSLESLLPPGKEYSPFMVATMSYDGHVLIEARDIASGIWEYYGYDGVSTRLLLDRTTRIITPRLGNDGQIYFIQQTGSRYSLFQTVPEPASMLLLCAISLVASIRRRALA